MLSHLDPYTTYFDADTVQKLESDIKGTFTGIGVQIRKDVEKDMHVTAAYVKKCTTPTAKKTAAPEKKS